MTFVGEIEDRVEIDSVVHQKGIEVLREADAEPADEAQPVFERAIGEAGVGRDRQTGLALQVLAERGVERLPGGSADAVRAGAEDEGRSRLGLLKGEPVRERARLVGTRVVLDSAGEGREEAKGQGRTKTGARNLVVDGADAERPPVLQRLGGPPDRPAFAGSERSTGDERSALHPHAAVPVFLPVFVVVRIGRLAIAGMVVGRL